MGKGLGKTLGEAYASVVLEVIEKYEKENPQYTAKLLSKIDEYSFRPRKKGEPMHEGCKNWVLEIESNDMSVPENLALVTMGIADRFYNKGTAKRFIDSLKGKLK